MKIEGLKIKKERKERGKRKKEKKKRKYQYSRSSSSKPFFKKKAFHRKENEFLSPRAFFLRKGSQLRVFHHEYE